MNTMMISIGTELRKAMAASNDIPDVLGLHLSEGTEQGSYLIARLLMDLVYGFLGIFGMEHNDTLFLWCYAALVFVCAWGVGILVQWISVFILRHLTPYMKSDIYKYLLQNKFFTKACRIIPAVFFLILIEFTLFGKQSLASWLSRLTWIYIVLILCNAISTLADVIWTDIDNRANKRRLPLNGVVQLIKMIIWIIGGIVIVGIIINKSPGSLLAGLGAFSAVLMLIFKDNILGVVAGIQLAENDSLHEGDWIVPNSGNANGVVVGVGLTAIKIENWDKTISTIPPYSLITSGFKNYRNMQQSQTREIQRSYMIDADSVVETNEVLLEKFAGIPMMKDWIEKKIQQKAAGKVEDVNNSEGLADGSIDTNLGVFRAYLKMWLDSNPNISHNDTTFVNTLAQTPYGIPLQVYCFTATSSWVPYEGIQSTIFEHIAIMLYRFNLYVYEAESGRDTIIDGYLSPGKSSDPIFGVPYPLYMNSGTPQNPGETAQANPQTSAPSNAGQPAATSAAQPAPVSGATPSQA